MGSPLLEFCRRNCCESRGSARVPNRPLPAITGHYWPLPAIYRPFATLLLPADTSEPFLLSQRSEARLS